MVSGTRFILGYEHSTMLGTFTWRVEPSISIAIKLCLNEQFANLCWSLVDCEQ